MNEREKFDMYLDIYWQITNALEQRNIKDESMIEEMTRNFPDLTIYAALRDRAYGGPEEGGWYYTTETPVKTFRTEVPFHEAMKINDKVKERFYEFFNIGRPKISSVLSQGEYELCVCIGEPKGYPETRPYYE
jgi:hypothetical protein